MLSALELLKHFGSKALPTLGTRLPFSAFAGLFDGARYKDN